MHLDEMSLVYFPEECCGGGLAAIAARVGARRRKESWWMHIQRTEFDGRGTSNSREGTLFIVAQFLSMDGTQRTHSSLGLYNASTAMYYAESLSSLVLLDCRAKTRSQVRPEKNGTAGKRRSVGRTD